MPDDPFLSRIHAEQAVRGSQLDERRREQTIQAILGDGNGTVAVPSRPGWAYARLHGDSSLVVEVWVPTSFPLVEGIFVDLRRARSGGGDYYLLVGRSAYVRYAQDPFASSGITGLLGIHAEQHHRRDRGVGSAFDPLDVETRMLVPVRGMSQAIPDRTAYVAPGYYWLLQFKVWPGGNSPQFTSAIALPRWDLLYINLSAQLAITKGVEGAAAYGDTPPFPPGLPDHFYPVLFVYMATDTTAITEANCVDARVLSHGHVPQFDPEMAAMGLSGWN